MEEQPIVLPKDLQKALEENLKAEIFWQTLPLENQNCYLRWIDRTKKLETRQKRIRYLVEQLEKNRTHKE